MLLVLDVDSTLAASPLVVGDDYAAWERMIIDTPPPVVEGAIEGVRDLAAVCTDALIITARSVRFYDVTAQWIGDAFPVLRGVQLLMRSAGDVRPSVLVKWDLLDGWRRRRMQDAAILLVDDNPAMRVALREYDRMLIAPGCWMGDARAVALSLAASVPKVAHG